MALHYFITNEWKFLNNRTLGLERSLIPEEIKEFEYDVDGVNVYEYFKNCLIYGRRYLLKEEDSTLEKAKVNLYRFVFLFDTLAVILLCL